MTLGSPFPAHALAATVTPQGFFEASVSYPLDEDEDGMVMPTSQIAVGIKGRKSWWVPAGAWWVISGPTNVPPRASLSVVTGREWVAQAPSRPHPALVSVRASSETPGGQGVSVEGVGEAPIPPGPVPSPFVTSQKVQFCVHRAQGSVGRPGTQWVPGSRSPALLLPSSQQLPAPEGAGPSAPWPCRSSNDSVLSGSPWEFMETRHRSVTWRHINIA